MLKKILTILPLVLFSAFCFGQKDLENGYIIKNDGEQVYGLIDIKSNAMNSKTCLFQNKDQETLESFKPDDIKGYKTATKYYVSHEVEIDSVKQKVFLEYLVDGIVDLYYLRDNVNEYYYIEKEGRMYPLQNDEIKVLIEGNGIDHNNKTFVKNSNQYKGALNYLFSDGQGLSQKIAQTPFNYRSLINLTKDYHNMVCNEYECIDYTRASIQNLSLEVSAGLFVSEMSLKTSKNSLSNLRPGITVQLRFVPLKSNTNWIFLIGLGYSSNNFHGLFPNQLDDWASIDTVELFEKYSIIRFPMSVQYEFGKKKLQPLFLIGYNAILYVGSDYAAYNHIHNVNTPENSDLRKFQHGFSSGLGLKYNISSSKYLFLKGIYEYRIPSANLGYVFDYVRHQTIMINFGLAFGI